jgi:ABC-type multidrug transport system ATPase subunit
VNEGELFAFLGENGAGKPTSINILCTVLSKTSGDVYIDGLDIDKDKEEIKKRIGIVFQGSILDNVLTVKEN